MANLKMIVSLFLFLFLSCVILGASEISETRMKKISSIVARFKEAGENLSDPDVQAAIFKEVSKFYALEPESKANLVTREELSKLVREKVRLKFPDTHEAIEKKAKENAEKIFKAAKINDYVRVNYEKGSKSFSVEGYFFGYGVMEHSINIGGNIIAIFDLIPEDRAKFDEKFREYQKDQYVKKQIRDYYTRKNDYSIELLKEEKEEIIKYNENAGYIFAMGKWMTPKELTSTLISSMETQGVVATIAPVPKDTKAPAETKPIPPNTQTDTSLNPEPVEQKSLDPKDKRIADIRRKAEIDQQKIKTRYAGIDADQGYGNAIWWMKHADVNLLFDQLVNKPPDGNSEILTFDRGPIQTVELYFYHGYFYKVVVNFRIAAPQAMEILYRKIVETYGKTDQEKSEEQAASEAEAGGQKSEEVTAEEITPEEMLLTWTGKETKGTLYLKLTPDKKSYSRFVLTKENSKVIEEVNLLIEKERKEKTETELKKLLDEYGDFKIK